MSDAPTVEPASPDANAEPVVADPAASAVVADPAVAAPPAEPTEPIVDNVVPNYDDLDLKFSGEDVVVTVDNDIAGLFVGTDIDVVGLTKELYEGEFGLGDATIKMLSEKLNMPEFAIRSTIRGIEAQNNISLKEAQDAAEKLKAANDTRWQETLKLVGSAENWETMSKWAFEAFSEEEIKQFEDVMLAGHKYAQDLAIKDLKERYSAANGDLDFTYIEPDNTGGGGEVGVMSNEAYQNLYRTGEWAKASPEQRRKWDAMRNAAIAKGI